MELATLAAVVIMSVLLPVCTITAFIIGYNINADRKIRLSKPKKPELSETEELLEQIDSATVY
jgi:hypothetical protein